MLSSLRRSAGITLCAGLLLVLTIACDSNATAPTPIPAPASATSTSVPAAPATNTALPAAATDTVTSAASTPVPAAPTTPAALGTSGSGPADAATTATVQAARQATAEADRATLVAGALGTPTGAPGVTDTPAPPTSAARPSPRPPTSTPHPTRAAATATVAGPAAATTTPGGASDGTPTEMVPPTGDTPVASPSETPGTPGPGGLTPNPGTPGPNPPLTPRIAGDLSQVERVPPGKHRIALTFDAGSSTGHVPEILAALARHNAHITFFVTGQWAEQNPDQVRAIYAAGDEIANHTYSHPSFPKLTDAEMITEMQKCETIIQGIIGVSTKPYWRPPFGDETGHVLDVVAAQGYRSIYWTWDSLDSIGKPKTKDFILKRVTEAPIELDGAIILQHVASDPSSQALPDILDRLYARGLKVVTITELLSP